MYFEGDDEEM
jgi:hypothetical protein